MIGVNEFLDELDERVKRELETPVDIRECSEFPNVDSLTLEKRQWVRLENVVAVVVDLKGSTKLDFKHKAKTSARLYEAVTGNCVRIAKRFEPDLWTFRATACLPSTTEKGRIRGRYVPA